MANKELKKIMTDLAAGHISQKEADLLLEGVKKPRIKPEKEIEGKSKGDKTHKRNKQIKSREVK